MRHVSRTHRVSLDWSFDRTNLDPKIQVRHFTRDEWNNLLCLFNISHFSSLCCAKKLGLLSCITKRMAKRMQEQKRRKQDCGEFQANGDEPDQFCCHKFFICGQSDCAEKSGGTQSFKSTGWIVRWAWCKQKSKFQPRRSVEFSRLAKGCSAGTSVQGNLSRHKDQEFLNYRETVCTVKLVAPLQGTKDIQETQ